MSLNVTFYVDVLCKEGPTGFDALVDDSKQVQNNVVCCCAHTVRVKIISSVLILMIM